MNEQPSWGLVLVRIAAGFVVLCAGIARLQHGFGEELVTRSSDAYAASPEVVRAFGESVVLKHPWFFSMAIVWGEVVCGLGLFLGLLTRPAGFVAAFLFVNGYFTLPEPQRIPCLLLGVCCFACGLSKAGLRSGADVFLQDKLPGWLTWSRSGGGAVAE